MKLFYYDLTGPRTSLIAAFIHLNRLAGDNIPSINQIIQMKAFFQTNTHNLGIPKRIGVDEKGNQIYIISFGKDAEIGLQVVYHLLEDYQVNDWRFFNTQMRVNYFIKFCGFFSETLTKYLVARELQKNYLAIARLVAKVKEWVE